MRISLNVRLLELERVLVDMDVRLDLRPERGGIRAAIVKADGAEINSVWASSLPAAIGNLHRSLMGWLRGDDIVFDLGSDE